MKELELIKKAQSGDRKAEEEILIKYKYITTEIANKYYVKGLDKDDLIQEGMIALSSSILDYKENKGASFKTFAYLCVERRILTKITEANNTKNRTLNEATSFTTVGEDEFSLDKNLPKEMIFNPESDDEELSDELLELIDNELTELEKRVITGYIEGKKYEDIAKELNKNIKSIDGALQRAKTKIRNAYRGKHGL